MILGRGWGFGCPARLAVWPAAWLARPLGARLPGCPAGGCARVGWEASVAGLIGLHPGREALRNAPSPGRHPSSIHPKRGINPVGGKIAAEELEAAHPARV